MSVVSSAFKAIGGILGLTSPGATKLPKRKKELGRMSLTELTKQQEKAQKRFGAIEARIGALGPKIGDVLDPTDPMSGARAISGERLRMKRLGRLKSKLSGASGRLTSVTAARQSLIRRGTAARAGRATAISTLLGRGI